MSEHEIEDVLGRYRVAGPPAELRGRVLAGRPSSALVRLAAIDYALAAAAAIVLAVWVGSEASRPAARENALEVARRQAVEQLTIELGGDDAARQFAELAVPAPIPVIPAEAQEGRW